MIPGMMKDKNYGEGGLNPWSVGDIYPLVIARVERRPYCGGHWGDRSRWSDYADEPIKSWNVLNADDDMSGFASYDDAFAAAKGYLAAKAAAKPVLSPFNPAAYDAEMTKDFVACLRGQVVFENDDEVVGWPGSPLVDNGNGSEC